MVKNKYPAPQIQMSRYRRHVKNRDRGYRNACGEAERPRRRGPKLRGRCRGPYAAPTSPASAAGAARTSAPAALSAVLTATPTSAAAVAIRFETI